MTDPELKLALANWLPAVVIHTANKAGEIGVFHWIGTPYRVGNAEWLHVAQLAEGQLSDDDWDRYCEALGGSLRACASATWQARVRGLLQVKGGAQRKLQAAPL